MIKSDRIPHIRNRIVDQARPLPLRLSRNSDGWLRNDPPRQLWAGGGGLPSIANEPPAAGQQRPASPVKK